MIVGEGRAGGGYITTRRTRTCDTREGGTLESAYSHTYIHFFVYNCICKLCYQR